MLKLQLKRKNSKAVPRRNISLKQARSKANYKRKKSKKEPKKGKKRREVLDGFQNNAPSEETRMWKLRMKFISQAKRYFGIPYARKYWTAEDAEYHSPLFLDCCGLVRKVLRDLRHEFGFRVGPWNQSYLFDTLPITIERIEDMKPGDLVFISAIYNNTKCKKQKHNLTHVEIWLGDGVKTIGARWQKGKVQVFDNYQFNATAYHSPKYIFKSIDTWLMGICHSHCPEHIWRLRSATMDLPLKPSFAQKSSSSATNEYSGAHSTAAQNASAEGSDTEDDNDVVDEFNESSPSFQALRGESLCKANLQLLSRFGRARSLPLVMQRPGTDKFSAKTVHNDQPHVVRRSQSDCVITKPLTSTVGWTSVTNCLDLVLPPVSVL